MYKIVPDKTNDLRTIYVKEILKNLSLNVLLTGSTGMSLYCNQMGYTDTTYKYLAFNYVDDDGNIVKKCVRDVDLISFDINVVKAILSGLGRVTSESSKESYSHVFKTRGIKRVEFLTLNLNESSLEVKTCACSHSNNILHNILKHMLKSVGEISIKFDLIELVDVDKKRSLSHNFHKVTQQWPVSNLMRNFYYIVDEDCDLIPKTFAKPLYGKTKNIGLINILEYLKMIMYYTDTQVPYITSSGDIYSEYVVDDEGYYEKKSAIIIQNAITKHYNPIINPHIKNMYLPSIKYRKDIEIKVLQDTFKLPEDKALMLKKNIDEHEMTCVCGDEYVKDINVIVLKCGHMMHTYCFSKHYIQKILYRINLSNATTTTESSNICNKCPYCRYEFDSLHAKPSSKILNRGYMNFIDQMYTYDEINTKTNFCIKS